MAVIDASLYVALINAHESDHAPSWAWFQQVQSAQDPIVAPVILSDHRATNPDEVLSVSLSGLEQANSLFYSTPTKE
jgi:hypothetical protein